MLNTEILRSTLTYNPETGVFCKDGKAVGSAKGHRYTRICLNKKVYYAHRLAWAYVTGAMPVNGVDHRDGDCHNNAWGNLREASQSQNLQNQRHSRGLSSDLLGVCWHKGAQKWRATIKSGEKARHLGLFVDPQEAHQAYLKAKRAEHGFCTI